MATDRTKSPRKLPEDTELISGEQDPVLVTRDPVQILDQLASEQGLTRPTDLEKLYGGMRGLIDDEFLAIVHEPRTNQRSGQT